LREQLPIAALPQRARAIKIDAAPLQKRHRAHRARNRRLEVVPDFDSTALVVVVDDSRSRYSGIEERRTGHKRKAREQRRKQREHELKVARGLVVSRFHVLSLVVLNPESSTYLHIISHSHILNLTP
jgi:hypothetical protein